MSELPQADVQQVTEETQAQLAQGSKINEFALSKAEASVKSAKQIWGVFQAELLSKIGDTPENREWILEKSALLQTSDYSKTYHAVQFMELFNYYVNGRQPWDLAALFIMNDHMRGFTNHAANLPLELLNVVDNKTAGAQDPRFTFDALPVSTLLADPQNARIPVKVETFTDIMYGYLEMFRFQKEVEGQVMTFVTTHPALRVKDNYVTMNSIYRWCEVEESSVKDAWMSGRSIVKKDDSYVTAANPIEDTATLGTQANETTTEL